MNPEILAIGKVRIDAIFSEEPALAIYRQPVDNILRNALHTLDSAGEALVATFQLAARQSISVYGILDNADMPWPTVKLADGTQAKLDPAGYAKYREGTNRDDRKKVMDAFFGKFKEFERTLGVAFCGNLKEDTVYTRVRKYPDSTTRALDPTRCRARCTTRSSRPTNENLPTLHRYAMWATDLCQARLRVGYRCDSVQQQG